VRPFAGYDRVVRIDAGVWTAACVDTDPISCAQRDAFAGEQEAGILHDALQLREHLTSDEILAHRHDGVGLEAVILRLRWQRQERGADDD